MDISVIVPFYKGNRYINDLLANVDATAALLMERCKATMEVLIINDSPDVAVECTAAVNIPVRVIPNAKNLGIHGSRIHGIREAAGKWIQLLDQDDLLVPENYADQFIAAQNADLTVGNAYYEREDRQQLLYANRKVMQYYICEERFIEIRDLIASPGHCLIRKDAFPAYWLENPMYINGADDFYLWMLMFHQKATVCLQEKPVYIHRNNAEGNLSYDLERMQRSNTEMCQLLQQCPDYPERKRRPLARSIYFKYLYDTKQLKLWDWLRFADKVFDNGVYKITTLFLRRMP